MQLSALSNEERRIYDLVVRRFLAVLLPPCVYEETVIRASIEKECFTARGKRMVEKGWQEAYEDNRYDEEDEAVSVSYTHLDVYKRQPWNWEAERILLCCKKKTRKAPAKKWETFGRKVKRCRREENSGSVFFVMLIFRQSCADDV